MKTTVCENCGGTAHVSQRNYRFEEFGIPVELQHIDVIDCPDCHVVDPIIPHIDELMDTLALAVLCSTCKLTGEEVRFLRKYVNMSAREFARFLHVEHTHLSKIENGRTEIGPRLDKLVRFVVLNSERKLADKIKGFMELMPEIKDSCPEDRPEIQIDPETGIYQYASA